MEEITDELLGRIRERASDPKRRYLNAAEHEARVELPVEEIERREEDWTRRNLLRSAAVTGKDMPAEEIERCMDEWRASRQATRRAMEAQMRSWGQTPPRTQSYSESEDYFSTSSEPPGAKPLVPPPTDSDWADVEKAVGQRMPDDLKRLYSVSDGGFGPGFTGLHPVKLIGSYCEDFRRRGPDYCGTVIYPQSFIPLAAERLDYHYDLETGRIISSNQNWENEELDVEDIYDIAFQSLAAMMEDWLSRP